MYGHLFSFPIVFQVVPDYICAYEQTRRQYYDIVLQRENEEDIFSLNAFSRILAQVDGFVPPFILLQDYGSEVVKSADPNIRFVKLTSDDELPVRELCQAIVDSLTYVEPAQCEVRSDFQSITFQRKDAAYLSKLLCSVGASPATDREDCSSRASSACTLSQQMDCEDAAGEDTSCMTALLSAMEV